MVIQHNMQAMNANRMLGMTSSAQAKSTEKLSSGYRINRAADDAAGLSISEKMRKQIRGLSQASTNAQDGISAVQTAEGALTEVHSMLQRMNELTVQSANGTNSETDRAAIQAEIDQLVTEIDRVSETTKFNETYLLKGDVDGTKATTYAYAEKSDYLGEGKVLYTKKDDGTFAEVAKGTLLDDSVTYYSGYKTINDVKNVGEKIDFSKGEIVGTKIDFNDTNAAAQYVEQKDTIDAGQNLYTYDSTNKVYAKVEDGAVFDTSETYYTMSDETGQIKYSAVANTAVTKTATNVAKDTMYDKDGNKVAIGEKIDTSETYFSKIDDTKDTISYVKGTKIIDQDDLYKKDAEGNYVKVSKGAEYEENITYYKLSEETGTINYSAVSQDTVSTAMGYVAAATMYDAAGNIVNVGDTVDTSKTYYSDVKLSSNTSYEGTEVTDLDEYKDKSGSFRFMNKDGNEIAANGLYSYFDENESYAGGLYVKDADGKLVEATTEQVEAYVDTGKAETGVLKLSLHVGADSADTNKISIEISAMSAESIGVDGLKVDTEEDATRAIDTISAALQRVSEQRSALGAVQNRLEHTIANLDNVVENTTSAESRIRDTDMAAEMVEYSKNNILAQAGQSMLAQANQSTQGVLSLLQ